MINKTIKPGVFTSNVLFFWMHWDFSGSMVCTRGSFLLQISLWQLCKQYIYIYTSAYLRVYTNGGSACFSMSWLSMTFLVCFPCSHLYHTSIWWSLHQPLQGHVHCLILTTFQTRCCSYPCSSCCYSTLLQLGFRSVFKGFNLVCNQHLNVLGKVINILLCLLEYKPTP